MTLKGILASVFLGVTIFILMFVPIYTISSITFFGVLSTNITFFDILKDNMDKFELVLFAGFALAGVVTGIISIVFLFKDNEDKFPILNIISGALVLVSVFFALLFIEFNFNEAGAGIYLLIVTGIGTTTTGVLSKLEVIE